MENIKIDPEFKFNMEEVEDDDGYGVLDLRISPLPIEDSTEDHPYTIEGVRVIFPYEAYQSQMDMMKLIILGAKNSEHCILESPTGTGKTAAILCSLLAWQKQQMQQPTGDEAEQSSSTESPSKRPRTEFNNSSNPSTIYYVSRTHSQLTQAVKQLQKTRYSQTPMAVLASRAHTCINPIALNPGAGSKVDEICEKMRKARIDDAAEAQGIDDGRFYPCKYYDYSADNVHGQHFADFLEQRNNKTWDIEDLKIFGSSRGCCPYYGIRKSLQPNARIIFCTYNNILNSHIRTASKIDLENSIVVFDEAHNIESVCRGIASKTISQDKLNVVREQLEAARVRDDIPVVKVQPLKNLANAIANLSNWFGLQVQHGHLCKIDFEVNSFVATFTSLGFGPEAVASLWIDFCKLEDKIRELYDSQAAIFKIERKAAKFISSLLHCLHFLFQRSESGEENPQYLNLDSYHVCLTNHVAKTSNADEDANRAYTLQVDKNLKLKILCLNPAITFKSVKNNARTVILTSGSLSPISSFAGELDMNFPHILQAQHVLGTDRMFSAIVNKVSNDSTNYLNFSFTQLFKYDNFTAYTDDLAQILSSLCSIVDYGILIFGPSKFLMGKLKRRWEESGDLGKIRELKDIYWEHESTGYQGQDTLVQMLEKYRESATRQRGAILFGFCRGKLSEGVDFPDNEARLVATIGIPLAPWDDAAVKAKRNFNNRKFERLMSNYIQTLNSGEAGGRVARPEYMHGEEWYYADAIRALNQAWGRCIRHSRDWGVVLALETRVQENFYCKKFLSQWMKNSLAVAGRTGEGPLSTIEPGLTEFLETFQGPRPEQMQPEVQVGDPVEVVVNVVN